ncbi:MAG UNVERIFIED_CONTAM: F0F1 ATP synthase subunit A [Planctomycetaceae bacterium]|jgi:F-type H+-transporting ATPase subunit a
MSGEEHQDNFHHVRDFAFFEVPGLLTSRHAFDDIGNVPWHVKYALGFYKAHSDGQAPQEPTLEQVNAAMVGKVLIPQPFAGTYQNPGFIITKFMVLQVLVLVLCLLIFRGLAVRIRSGQPARGRFWNLWEMMALAIRDQVVRPTIGDHHHDSHDSHGDHHGADDSHGHHASAAATGGHPADRYLPFVWSCFFYILFCNLLGAVPSMGSATGDISVTGALAVCAFVATTAYGMQSLGFGGFFGNLIPNTGMSGFGGVAIGGLMFVIEGLGFLIKHLILAMRLFGNIMGGHTALGVILGFIATAAKGPVALWSIVTIGSLLGQVGVGLLELLVAVLQAYVFSFLATIFIASAVHKH